MSIVGVEKIFILSNFIINNCKGLSKLYLERLNVLQDKAHQAFKSLRSDKSVFHFEVVNSKTSKLQEAFALFWLALDTHINDEGFLEKDGYILFRVALQRSLLEDDDIISSRLQIEEEYLVVMYRYGNITRRTFNSFLYEILETWSDMTESRDIVILTWAVLDNILEIRGPKPTLKPFQNIRCILRVKPGLENLFMETDFHSVTERLRIHQRVLARAIQTQNKLSPSTQYDMQTAFSLSEQETFTAFLLGTSEKSDPDGDLSHIHITAGKKSPQKAQWKQNSNSSTRPTSGNMPRRERRASLTTTLPCTAATTVPAEKTEFKNDLPPMDDTLHEAPHESDASRLRLSHTGSMDIDFRRLDPNTLEKELAEAAAQHDMPSALSQHLPPHNLDQLHLSGVRNVRNSLTEAERHTGKHGRGDVHGSSKGRGGGDRTHFMDDLIQHRPVVVRRGRSEFASRDALESGYSNLLNAGTLVSSTATDLSDAEDVGGYGVDASCLYRQEKKPVVSGMLTRSTVGDTSLEEDAGSVASSQDSQASKFESKFKGVGNWIAAAEAFITSATSFATDAGAVTYQDTIERRKLNLAVTLPLNDEMEMTASPIPRSSQSDAEWMQQTGEGQNSVTPKNSMQIGVTSRRAAGDMEMPEFELDGSHGLEAPSVTKSSTWSLQCDLPTDYGWALMHNKTGDPVALPSLQEEQSESLVTGVSSVMPYWSPRRASGTARVVSRIFPQHRQQLSRVAKKSLQRIETPVCPSYAAASHDARLMPMPRDQHPTPITDAVVESRHLSITKPKILSKPMTPVKPLPSASSRSAPASDSVFLTADKTFDEQRPTPLPPLNDDNTSTEEPSCLSGGEIAAVTRKRVEVVIPRTSVRKQSLDNKSFSKMRPRKHVAGTLRELHSVSDLKAAAGPNQPWATSIVSDEDSLALSKSVVRLSLAASAMERVLAQKQPSSAAVTFNLDSSGPISSSDKAVSAPESAGFIISRIKRPTLNTVNASAARQSGLRLQTSVPVAKTMPEPQSPIPWRGQPTHTTLDTDMKDPISGWEDRLILRANHDATQMRTAVLCQKAAKISFEKFTKENTPSRFQKLKDRAVAVPLILVGDKANL